MPTLTITREVGNAKDGRALCKGWNGFLLCQRSSTVDQISISENTFQTLRKNKLIEKYEGSYIWWQNWYGRRNVWVVSDAGKEFKLPPIELWLEEEWQPSSSPSA